MISCSQHASEVASPYFLCVVITVICRSRSESCFWLLGTVQSVLIIDGDPVGKHNYDGDNICMPNTLRPQSSLIANILPSTSLSLFTNLLRFSDGVLILGIWMLAPATILVLVFHEPISRLIFTSDMESESFNNEYAYGFIYQLTEEASSLGTKQCNLYDFVLPASLHWFLYAARLCQRYRRVPTSRTVSVFSTVIIDTPLSLSVER